MEETSVVGQVTKLRCVGACMRPLIDYGDIGVWN